MSQKNETVYIALHLAYVREHEKGVLEAISLHQALRIVWNGMMDRVIVTERRWSLFFVLLLKILFAKFFHIIIIWYICTIIEIDMAKVIHVHLLCRSRYERKDYYFASISAIYTVLKPEEVGATKNYLLHAGLSGNGTVCTKKAIIKQSTLIRCSRRQDGADWRKNAVRTAFWRCCIWMLFGGVECSPFFVLDYAVFDT